MYFKEDDKLEKLLEKNDENLIFNEMFEIENIQKGKSSLMLKSIGYIEEIYKILKVDPLYGLNTEDITDINSRISNWGTNYFIDQNPKNFFFFVLVSLEDKLLRILILAGMISLTIGIIHEGLSTGWIEGFVILIAVLIVVAITALNNWNKEIQFSKLNRENRKKQVIVRRNGIKILEISVEDLLVGDILYLKIGDIIPVDGILIEGKLGVDESPMTGESNIIKKTVNLSEESAPFLISGTMVKEGSGEMIVCTVGKNTQCSLSKEKLTHDYEVKTPLQEKLNYLANRIGDFGLLAAISIGTILIMKEILFRIALRKEYFTFSMLETILNAFIISITVIVVAIPEGLPMAVTISLAYSVMKMKQENNLVRHIDASETMGNVNNICVDKTGTLTTGIMTVREVLIGLKTMEINNNLCINCSTLQIIAEAIINNVTAWIDYEDGKFISKGNSTECALLDFLIKNCNINFSKFRYKQEPVNMFPFNSKYKFMCSIYKLPDDKFIVFVKGAPEFIIKKCISYYVDIKGEETLSLKQIDDEFLKFFNQTLSIYGEKAERTLAIASKEISSEEYYKIQFKFQKQDNEFFEEIIHNLNLICLFGISDSPRKEVKKALEQCRSAGIIVRMITGDNLKTAIAIAKEVGILSEKEAFESLLKISDSKKEKKLINQFNGENIYALEGEDFRRLSGGYTEKKKSYKGEKIKFKLNDRKLFASCVKNLKVLARASPDDKFLLVIGLKELRNIVAVTGDGTNDAVALKHSHVGFSMGKKGTDIAKEASDIILLDDSFNSIVTAIKYGRNVYDSIRKFLQFQLTINIVAIFMTLLGGVILKDAPLNPIQMLWINLIMDSFASLALSTDRPSDSLLKRKPYGINDPIITQMMEINIVSQSVFQIILLTIIIFYGDMIFAVSSDRQISRFEWNDYNGHHYTIFFNIFVFLQVFNSINSRKLNKYELNVFTGIFDNNIYIFIQLAIIIIQILIVQYGGKVLRTIPLSLNEHVCCILISSLSILNTFLVKLIPFSVKDDQLNYTTDSNYIRKIPSISHSLKFKKI